MGKRQKICLLCAEGDREALQPVLDALQARGVAVGALLRGRGAENRPA